MQLHEWRYAGKIEKGEGKSVLCNQRVPVKTSVSHPVQILRAGAFFIGVTLRNFFDSLRVFSLRRIFIFKTF